MFHVLTTTLFTCTRPIEANHNIIVGNAAEIELTFCVVISYFNCANFKLTALSRPKCAEDLLVKFWLTEQMPFTLYAV